MLLPLFATGVLIALIFLRYSLRRRNYSQLMPGNKYYFYNIFGDLTKFNFLKSIQHQMIDVAYKIVKCFPNDQLVCMWISYVPYVFVFKADAVKMVLKENRMIEKSHQYEYLKPVFGTGLIVSPSVKWKSRRKFFNPCFHPDILRKYLKTFNGTSQKLVNMLKMKPRKTVEILDPLILCAFDSLCETIFDFKVGESERTRLKVSNSITRFASIAMIRGVSIWLWPEFIFRKTAIGKESDYCRNVIQEFTKKIIEETKTRYLNGERTSPVGKHKALIDVLLEKHLETKEFSEEDVREEINTFISAGHETIALSAVWAIYLIGQYPDVQEKLHEEIDLVFGDDIERPVTEKDLKDLQYLDCVLKECNRMYPPVPLFGRSTSEDTNICGSIVPKDTACFILTYVLHRDEKIFPEPEKFDPERFSQENRVNIPEFAYIPFSAGPRNCIGYKFAEMEVGVIMCSILRNFTVKTLNKVLPLPGISLQTSEAIRIKIIPRAG